MKRRLTAVILAAVITASAVPTIVVSAQTTDDNTSTTAVQSTFTLEPMAQNQNTQINGNLVSSFQNDNIKFEQNGSAISVSGELKYINLDEHFSSNPEHQKGYYLAFTIKPDESTLNQLGENNKVIVTTQNPATQTTGENAKTVEFSYPDTHNNTGIDYLVFLGDNPVTALQNLTIQVDWDGSGSAFSPSQTITLKPQNLTRLVGKLDASEVANNIYDTIKEEYIDKNVSNVTNIQNALNTLYNTLLGYANDSNNMITEQDIQQMIRNNIHSLQNSIKPMNNNVVNTIPPYQTAPSEWKHDATGWWYQNGDGSFPTNSWKNINQRWYYFKSNGYMATGWTSINGKWYYLNPTDGAMTTGWISIGGTWYYLNADGSMATGWNSIHNSRYFFNANGSMVTGWTLVDNKWYYLSSSGIMQTGWHIINGKWYYLNTDGVMATGWNSINGKWYFFNANGSMATGWTLVDNKWYYLNADGSMKTGWSAINRRWYYLNADGSMATGWVYSNGQYYYLNSSGVMLANGRTPDGYIVNEKGQWVG